MSAQNTALVDVAPRTSAMGMVRFAHDFLEAAMHEHTRAHHPTDFDISSAPGMYLIGHSIELSLKAFLINQGMTSPALRKLGRNGHDLVKAFRSAVSYGLECDLQIEDGEVALLELLNDSYAVKEFEYITTGATRWPRFSDISALACKLYNASAQKIGYNKTLTPLVQPHSRGMQGDCNIP